MSILRMALLLHAKENGRSITYNQTPRKGRKRSSKNMGNPLNPPDKKKNIAKKWPKGLKSLGHTVEIEYENENGEGTTWSKVKIICYSKNRGYCIRFEGEGAKGDVWEKRLGAAAVRFVS